MGNKVIFNEARLALKVINNRLKAEGNTLKDIDDFWKQCIKQVRTEHVMARFFDGLSDGEIARESGYCASVISNITSQHWQNKMEKHE